MPLQTPIALWHDLWSRRRGHCVPGVPAHYSAATRCLSAAMFKVLISTLGPVHDPWQLV